MEDEEDKSPKIGFDQSDIFEYFASKDGKVVYSEIVTFFKKYLSDPETQVEARIKFKDYVNVLATVTIENNKKFLVLRPKYMKKLLNDSSCSSLSSVINGSKTVAVSAETETISSPTIIVTAKPTIIYSPPPLISNTINESIQVSSPIYGSHHYQYQIKDNDNLYGFGDDSLNPSHGVNGVNIHHNNTTSSNHHNQLSSSTYCNKAGLPLTQHPHHHHNTSNSSHNHSFSPEQNGDINEVPPRPPPRKKGSFSKSKTQLSSTNSLPDNASNQQQQLNADTTEGTSKMEPKTNHEVKKEIQELAKTPGRVKEHAQILNKLASSDFKLPMPIAPSSNSPANLNSQVASKIRNINNSDTDSGSVQILDTLKKRWILAASSCDFNELLTLLKEDCNLSSYCDYILGYNALHWAAKFNKPEIINLIAGHYAVNVNIKSFSGCTPLHIAAQFRNELIMKLLTETYGADLDARDNNGKKAFHYLTIKEKKPNQSSVKYECVKKPPITSDSKKQVPNGTSNHTNAVPAPSASENLRTNLRNKISHQSMLVRNTLRKSKAFQRRKSITSKG